ncbi:MAG: c-type cytochrome [Spirosomataceae bacterium]
MPEEFRKGKKGVVVATEKALQLVNYLQSLKQVKLPDGTPQPEFLYKKEKKEGDNAGGDDGGLDGAAVYAANCQSCHQANGEGLKGAFPPLKGSKIVIGDDVELFVKVIMKGYDARGDYGVMPAIGENNNLSAEEVTAIMNHERTSWGNKGKKVSVEEVKKIMEMLGSPQ